VAHRRPVDLRVSLKLKASARGIAKSGKVPVFRLLGFFMLVSVPLPVRSHAMHYCSVAIFFMCEVRGKLISVLQATRTANRLSTIILFQTFLTRSLSPF
jgi:hypothetical protein